MKNQQEIYKNSVSFYRAVSYLEKSGFVESEKIINGRQIKRYKLTKLGASVARRILCLIDVRRQFSRYFKEYRPLEAIFLEMRDNYG